jgi:hypothetical protein
VEIFVKSMALFTKVSSNSIFVRIYMPPYTICLYFIHIINFYQEFFQKIVHNVPALYDVFALHDIFVIILFQRLYVAAL